MEIPPFYGICLETARKTKETSVRTVGVPAKIWMKDHAKHIINVTTWT